MRGSIKNVLSFLCVLQFAVSCNGVVTGENSTQNVYVQHLSDYVDTEFIGVSDSGISGYDSKWRLILGDSNKVLLLRTYITEKNNFRRNDTQLFLSIKKSDNQYDYELTPDYCLSASGCNKPAYQFLYSDSTAIHIDSISLNNLQGGVFQIKSEMGYDTSFIVNSREHIYRTIKANGELDTSCFVLTYEPMNHSKIRPFSVVGGDRCGMSVHNYCSSSKFYLNQLDESFMLVVDGSNRYRRNEVDTIRLTATKVY